MKTLNQLLHEYENTDSISSRQTLKGLIEDKCTAFITEKDKIASKYDIDVIDDSDYISDEGGWAFTKDSYIVTGKDSYVILYYERMWRFGGYCNIGYAFLANELDSFNASAFEEECKQKKLKRLQEIVSFNRNKLNDAEEELKDFLKNNNLI